jgi:hypothetical protein
MSPELVWARRRELSMVCPRFPAGAAFGTNGEKGSALVPRPHSRFAGYATGSETRGISRLLCAVRAIIGLSARGAKSPAFAIATGLLWAIISATPANALGDRISQINAVLSSFNLVFNRVFLTMYAEYPLDAPRYARHQPGPTSWISCAEEPHFLDAMEKAGDRYRLANAAYAAMGLGDAVSAKGPTSVWPIRCIPVTYVAVDEKVRLGRLRIKLPNLIDPVAFVDAVAALAQDFRLIEQYRVTRDRAEFLAYAYSPASDRPAGSMRKPVIVLGGYSILDEAHPGRDLIKNRLAEIDFAVPPTIETFDKHIEVEFRLLRIRL